MTLFLLSEVMAKRGISHRQSRLDPNFATICELVDGRSVPVVMVNLVDGSFLEMPHYEEMEVKAKIKLAEAQAEYHRRFKARRKKS